MEQVLFNFCAEKNQQEIILDDMVFAGTPKTFCFETASIAFKKPVNFCAMYFRNDSDADIFMENTNGKKYRLAKSQQGYLPIFVPLDSRFNFSAQAANGVLKVSFFNFNIPPWIW